MLTAMTLLCWADIPWLLAAFGWRCDPVRDLQRCCRDKTDAIRQFTLLPAAQRFVTEPRRKGFAGC